MLRTFFTRKTNPIVNSAAPKAIAIHTTWKPAWSDADLIHTLALLAGHKEGEPFDARSSALAAYLTAQGAHTLAGAPAVLYQSSPVLAIGGALWHHGREYELALYGTPEAMLARCDMTESEREDVSKKFAMLTKDGSEVVAVAYSILKAAPLTLGELPKKEKPAFAGLVRIT